MILKSRSHAPAPPPPRPQPTARYRMSLSLFSSIGASDLVDKSVDRTQTKLTVHQWRRWPCLRPVSAAGGRSASSLVTSILTRLCPPMHSIADDPCTNINQSSAYITTSRAAGKSKTRGINRPAGGGPLALAACRSKQVAQPSMSAAAPSPHVAVSSAGRRPTAGLGLECSAPTQFGAWRGSCNCFETVAEL